MSCNCFFNKDIVQFFHYSFIINAELFNCLEPQQQFGVFEGRLDFLVFIHSDQVAHASTW